MTPTTVDLVIATARDDLVIAQSAENVIVAGSTVEVIVLRRTDQRVISTIAVEIHVSLEPLDHEHVVVGVSVEGDGLDTFKAAL